MQGRGESRTWDRGRSPMTDLHKKAAGTMPPIPMAGLFAPAIEYLTDAAQRSILFLDVMRQRGNAYREHAAKIAPHVLEYEFKPIMDGRKLDRPVNYVLVEIVP